MMSEKTPWLRPDLVYYEGYVHRRMTDIPLDGIRGSHFYEVSTVAGAGCSGGPIVAKNAAPNEWKVFGVYVGERIGVDSLTDRPRRSVGYAARLDAITDWYPKIYNGQPVVEEVPDIVPRKV